MNLRIHPLGTIFATLTLLLGAGSASAAGNAPTWLMTAGQRVPDVELPSQAARGSGIASTLNPAALGAPGLLVPLADGRVLHATRQRVAEDTARGRQSWIGTFEDQAGSLVVLSKVRGVTTGFITYGVETFEILPSKGGRHMLYEVDGRNIPDAEPVLFTDDIAGDTGGTTDYGTGGIATDGFVHDLLVVYTPASRVKYGQDALESMILSAVSAANQAYLNSGVGITLNLVGLQETSYAETPAIIDALNDLRGSTDGKMDSVHALRDQLGADLVSLVSQNTDACGIAWVMSSESTGFASSAFSVVASNCLSQHSLAHELGHNQGNMHDRMSTTNKGAFVYSYGYRRCDTTDGSGFRTVMSYSCSGAPRVTQFSNPNVTFNGWPTGISYEADPASSAENARSMNNTADTVAAFRGAASGGTGGTTPAAPASPSSLSASAISTTSVSLRWSDNSSDESGFKVERSGNGVDFTEIASLGAGTTSFTDNGLTARTGYWYRVRAFNSVGSSGYSNTSPVTTPDAAPASPQSVSATNIADGSASVTWQDASSNESGFEVQRAMWDSRRKAWKGAVTVGAVPAGVTSLVDLSGNGTFRYSVRAVASGTQSGYAGPAEVTVTGGATTTKGKRGQNTAG